MSVATVGRDRLSLEVEAAIGAPDSELLARGVAVAIGSVLTAEVFVSQQFSKPLWLLLAVAPALRAIAQESSRPA